MTRAARGWKRAALLAIALAVACDSGLAQSGRATMRGWIEFEGVGRNNVKERGIVARVELVGHAGSSDTPPIVTSTDEIGRYLIERVPAGEYTLRINAPGFRTYEAELYLPSDFDCRVATLLRVVE